MADTPQYLVGFRHEGEQQFEPCASLEEALGMIRGRVETGHFDCELWERIPFTVTVGIDLASPSRRKRKDSPAPGQPSETTPAAETAPKAGDVRPPGGAPPATSSDPARPSCGGKACEVKGGIDVHRMDASCAKFTGNRKGAAAR